MKDKLRIILADDHKIIRAGLKALINEQPDMHVIAEAGDGRGALELVRKHAPDVLVLDISMPNMNGLQAMAQLQRDRLAVKTLILTAYSDVAYLRQMLAAGAAGYIQKKAAADELIKAVRVIVEGGVYIDPALAGTVAAGWSEQKRVRGVRQGVDLSARETEVLRAVARGYTNKEIAAQLGLSVKTIETHKANSMEKLELRSRSEAVRYALHQGWLEE